VGIPKSGKLEFNKGADQGGGSRNQKAKREVMNPSDRAQSVRERKTGASKKYRFTSRRATLDPRKLEK